MDLGFKFAYNYITQIQEYCLYGKYSLCLLTPIAVRPVCTNYYPKEYFNHTRVDTISFIQLELELGLVLFQVFRRNFRRERGDYNRETNEKIMQSTMKETLQKGQKFNLCTFLTLPRIQSHSSPWNNSFGFFKLSFNSINRIISLLCIIKYKFIFIHLNFMCIYMFYIHLKIYRQNLIIIN